MGTQSQVTQQKMGNNRRKNIPGYDFVKTVVDKDGNTQHIYKKTVTPTPMPDPTPTPEPQPQPTPQPTPEPQPEEPTIPVVPETKEEVKYIDPQNPTVTTSKHRNKRIFYCWSCNL